MTEADRIECARILAGIEAAYQRENPSFARTPIGRAVVRDDAARIVQLLDPPTADPLDLAAPEWAHYFAGVDATFTAGESRARRFPRKRDALRVR